MTYVVPSEEHLMFRDSARQFLQLNCPVSHFRQLRDDRVPCGYSAARWDQMCDLGWSGIIVPEQYGGLDFGYVGLGALMNESGRVLLASPLFATVCLCTQLIIRAGSGQQRDRILPGVVQGKIKMALAIDELPHHDPLATRVEARRVGRGYVINGRKKFVVDGDSADYFVLVARTSGAVGETHGLSMFLVEADRAGIQREKLDLIDARNYVNLEFDSVVLQEGDLLGPLDSAWGPLEETLDVARVLLAAEMLGGVSECFDRTINYLNEREQFGVKIGSFQALRHRAAQLFTEIELCKAVVDSALAAIDTGAGDLPVLASLAKARVNALAEYATNEAVQMHGGIGITDELDIGLFLKRARVSMQILGDCSYHRDRFARLSAY